MEGSERIAMKELSMSLSDTEIDELEAFLMSDNTPEECMDISTLDGFLTALVIGPDTIMPSRWLQVVWGETDQDEMVWESPEKLEHLMGLVMRLYNSISQDFDADPPDFNPLFMINTVPDEDVTIIYEWCWGFMQAVDLARESWQPLFEDKEPGSGLFPIIIHGTEDGWKLLEEDPRLSAIPHEEWVEMMPTAVRKIYEFWLPLRKAEMQATRSAVSQKLGRNEPCPCGSGRKYKKCCGSVAEA